MTIHLHQLLFYAYHGLHPEETIIGGNYEVNVDLELHSQPAVVTQLQQTINYELVFKLINKRMEIATPLLETLAMLIAEELLHHFAAANSISVQIFKLQPPIMQLQGRVGVSYKKER